MGITPPPGVHSNMSQAMNPMAAHFLAPPKQSNVTIARALVTCRATALPSA
jgi:hypothetical protein